MQIKATDIHRRVWSKQGLQAANMIKPCCRMQCKSSTSHISTHAHHFCSRGTWLLQEGSLLQQFQLEWELVPYLWQTKHPFATSESWRQHHPSLQPTTLHWVDGALLTSAPSALGQLPCLVHHGWCRRRSEGHQGSPRWTALAAAPAHTSMH